jgi:hypothetical protein
MLLKTLEYSLCSVHRDEVLIACQPMVNSQEIMASMIFLLNLITAFFILPMNDVILVWVIYWNLGYHLGIVGLSFRYFWVII